MPKYLTNTTYFSDNLGSLIQNGIVTTKELVVNGGIDLSGSIVNGVNSLTFNQPNELTVVEKNFKITGMGYILYQGTTYNIGELLAAFSGTGQISPYPSITYDSSLNLTSFTGGMSFPSQSISSASINNSDFITKTTNQSNLTGIKTWSGTQIFSSIQLNDNLIVNSGGTTILNSNLALINFLSGTSGNINSRFSTNESNITTLQSKTTGLSYNLVVTTTTCAGRFIFNQTPTCAQSLRLDASLLVGTGGNVTITNAQLQLIPSISTIQTDTNALKVKTQYLTFTTNNSTFSQTLNANNFNFTGNINSTFTKTQFDTAINFSKDFTSSGQTQINSINTNITTNTNDISTLQTKTQYISSTALNTTISNTTNLTDIVFSGNLNTIPASYFTGINANIQDSINDAITKANNAQGSANDAIGKANNAQNKADSAYNLASGAQGTASSAFALATTAQATGAGALALAGSAQASANTANSGLATLNTQVDGIEVDVTELQVKCTQITYNSATGRTSVIDTLYSPFLEIGNLESGFTQTSTDQITLAGLLRCNNRVEINNTLELVNNNNIILEGVINQDNAAPPNDAVNQFLAPTNILGTLTVSGNQSNSGTFTTSGLQTSLNSTNIQIGTTTASTLTINSNTTCNGDITMLTNKNLRLKNIVPILLDDLMFGDAAGTYNNYDIIFNMQLVANQPLTLNANFQQGTNLARKTYLGYNDTYTTYASTSATLSSPSVNLTATNMNLTSTSTLSVSSVTNNIISSGTTSITGLTTNIDGTFVNIGNVLSTNILYGSTYVQALYSPSGTINAIGTVMQQFV